MAAPGGTVGAPSPLLHANLQRLHTQALFPRNNLIEGSCSVESPNAHLNSEKQLYGVESAALQPDGASSRERPMKIGGKVRVLQLKEMRRKASFAQEQAEFVGKLTTEQLAQVEAPMAMAEQRGNRGGVKGVIKGLPSVYRTGTSGSRLGTANSLGQSSGGTAEGMSRL